MATLRLFIAAEIGYGQHSAVERLLNDLKKGVQFTPARPKWVNPAALHITLKFLGSVDESRIDSIAKAVDRALNGFSAFEFSLAGLGVFPDPRQPKVLWVGVKTGKRNLVELAENVERETTSLGFEPDRRPFSAHLTLARMSSQVGMGAMMGIVTSHRDCDLGASLMETVTLYQSTLASEGATYTALRRWTLK
ncbi:RNA 2',3'-cyclic phosphodiesterase [Candidatus Sumerlaeota bacterium]|nr:RNA 2',3'-cyclic phosphodiesterase [Candidatus Sumerlaeota bacterium]